MAATAPFLAWMPFPTRVLIPYATLPRLLGCPPHPAWALTTHDRLVLHYACFLLLGFWHPIHDCHFPPCCPHPARDLTPCIKWPLHGCPFSLSGVLTSHIRLLFPVDALLSLLVLWLLTLGSSPCVDTLVTLLGFWHSLLDCPLQHGPPSSRQSAWPLSPHVGCLPLRTPSFTVLD